ncbi:hypothetical protein [Ferrovum sp.]|uniref:hypothetical protein n=1 Tax=Ferrovum sp. TaxID=2609467 RepID=UPI00260D69C8|nr:hypothetical protein [Ferrovum sp.]
MEVNQALCFLGIDSISRFGSSVFEFVLRGVALRHPCELLFHALPNRQHEAMQGGKENQG